MTLVGEKKPETDIDTSPLRKYHGIDVWNSNPDRLLRAPSPSDWVPALKSTELSSAVSKANLNWTAPSYDKQAFNPVGATSGIGHRNICDF